MYTYMSIWYIDTLGPWNPAFLYIYSVHENFKIMYIYISIWYIDRLGAWKPAFMYIYSCLWNFLNIFYAVYENSSVYEF